MVSTKGRYALRLMVDIATFSNDKYVSLSDISKRQDISIKYLEQIVSILTKANFLTSLRGNNGGYKLSKNINEYSVGEILKVAEGTLAPVECLSCEMTKVCTNRERCCTIDFWLEYNNNINDFLYSKSLEELVQNYKEKLKREKYE